MKSGAARNWRLMPWAMVAAILAAPLLAMQFTDEVRWTASDFAAAGILLIAAAAIYEIAARCVVNGKHRLIIGGVLTLAVLLLWAEGAAGIF